MPSSPSLPEDTIAAIASSPGGAYRGIVRISGANTAHCLRGLGVPQEELDQIHSQGPSLLSTEIELFDPQGRLPCDIYYWPTKRSYTRQPTAELHTLGSPPLLTALLNHLCKGGARLAEPGEFTLRAFLAGRIDLTQAEAVLGAIDAEDRTQLDTALAQMAGGLSTPFAKLKNDLLEILAHLEASLDFVDEDIQFISSDDLSQQLSRLTIEIENLSAQLTTRRRDEAAFRVVLSGLPNAGKSSLLNALAGKEASIVSDMAGTTRDYVTRSVQWEGHSILLIDTAGVESSTSSEDQLLKEAQQESLEQVRQADIELLCFDSTTSPSQWEQQIKKRGLTSRLQISIATKSDIAGKNLLPVDEVKTSSLTGEGIDTLRHKIVDSIEKDIATNQHAVPGTAIRCHQSLEKAALALARSQALLAQEGGEELIAEEVRTALHATGQIVGDVYTDDLLDTIFSQFCIGK